MNRFTVALLTLPLSALAQASSAPVQEDFAPLLAEKAQAAKQLTVAELFREARQVGLILGDEGGAAFDREVDRLLQVEDNDPRTTLFLVATRLTGDEPDLEILGASLAQVLKASDPEASQAAAELAAGAGFDRGPLETRRTFTEALIAVATDGDRAPDTRVSAAVAAHGIGLGDQIARPRRVLFEFLESSDLDMVGRGALGLAELGAMEEVQGVVPALERLSAQPGQQGLLARSYLKQLQIRRFKDTELRRARERQAELLLQGDQIDPDLQRIDNLIELVRRFHLEGDTVEREDLLEAAMQGLLNRMDPHSSFFNSKSWEKFEQDIEAEYGGIGAYVNVDREDGLFTITKPIYSGPAYKAGLYTDDKIVMVDDWPTMGEESTEVIKRLKGRPNTAVKLYIWRRGMDSGLIDRPTEDMAVTIERGVITIPPVHSAMLPGGIGLIELSTFSRVASSEVASALHTLMEQDLRGVILDLRNNTGGLLDEARNVADLFLPKGKVVVSTESRVRAGRSYPTRQAALVPEDMPVVVLINRFSASASEIVAGALQDHGRAALIGQRSYGKGSVQNLISMPGEEDDGYADENRNGRRDAWESITTDRDGDGEFDYAPRVKLTIEKYLLPSGRSIHRMLEKDGSIKSVGGVQPDLEVTPTKYSGWRLKEMRRIQGTRKLRIWAQEQATAQAETFSNLADSDMSDWQQWPGFEELYAGLETSLSHADVRLLLRAEVRRHVEDTRGSAFPMGDFQEDRQLQAAIQEIYSQKQLDWTTVAEFKATFDTEVDDPDGPPVAAVSAALLGEALSLLGRAESADRSLSSEELKQLRELLRRTNDGVK